MCFIVFDPSKQALFVFSLARARQRSIERYNEQLAASVAASESATVVQEDDQSNSEQKLRAGKKACRALEREIKARNQRDDAIKAYEKALSNVANEHVFHSLTPGNRPHEVARSFALDWTVEALRLYALPTTKWGFLFVRSYANVMSAALQACAPDVKAAVYFAHNAMPRSQFDRLKIEPDLKYILFLRQVPGKKIYCFISADMELDLVYVTVPLAKAVDPSLKTALFKEIESFLAAAKQTEVNLADYGDRSTHDVRTFRVKLIKTPHFPSVPVLQQVPIMCHVILRELLTTELDLFETPSLEQYKNFGELRKAILKSICRVTDYVIRNTDAYIRGRKVLPSDCCTDLRPSSTQRCHAPWTTSIALARDLYNPRNLEKAFEANQSKCHICQAELFYDSSDLDKTVPEATHLQHVITLGPCQCRFHFNCIVHWLAKAESPIGPDDDMAYDGFGSETIRCPCNREIIHNRLFIFDQLGAFMRTCEIPTDESRIKTALKRSEVFKKLALEYGVDYNFTPIPKCDSRNGFDKPDYARKWERMNESHKKRLRDNTDAARALTPQYGKQKCNCVSNM